MRYLSVLIFLLLVFAPRADTQSAQHLAKTLSASTVILEIRDANGRVSHGTGFFIGEGLIATNHHVIEAARSGTCRLVNTQQQFKIHGSMGKDADRDMAILRVSNTQAPALQFGDSDTVQRGDTVYTMGNPRDFEGVFSQGQVSNLIPNGIPGISGKVIQFTAAISRGSSGGAVVNQNGQVIGIVSQTRDDGQNLNFAVPVNALKQLLQLPPNYIPFSPQVTKTSEPETNRNENKLLRVILLSIIAFGAIYFLPLAKVEKIGMTIAIAIGYGLFNTIAGSIMQAGMTDAMLHTLHTMPDDENLAHILDCFNCFPRLLIQAAKIPTYIVSIAFLFAIASKVIRPLELNGFFYTFALAAAVVVAEITIYWLLPF
ncbi:hypothetical protein C6497_03310 [Candidatus Poribacteria bacterium]|nr:MAG: hypothetical protein C6497_03310 [Candidatus Poribacteria bacterium]